eukprot:1158987-Pelagomonas_calceolata.AAC.1
MCTRQLINIHKSIPNYFGLYQRNEKLFYSMSEILDLLLAGMNQPQADQPNSLAEGLPDLNLIHKALSLHQARLVWTQIADGHVSERCWVPSSTNVIPWIKRKFQKIWEVVREVVQLPSSSLRQPPVLLLSLLRTFYTVQVLFCHLCLAHMAAMPLLVGAVTF